MRIPLSKESLEKLDHYFVTKSMMKKLANGNPVPEPVEFLHDTLSEILKIEWGPIKELSGIPVTNIEYITIYDMLQSISTGAMFYAKVYLYGTHKKYIEISFSMTTQSITVDEDIRLIEKGLS